MRDSILIKVRESGPGFMEVINLDIRKGKVVFSQELKGFFPRGIIPNPAYQCTVSGEFIYMVNEV